jgi:hypothetical protein
MFQLYWLSFKCLSLIYNSLNMRSWAVLWVVFHMYGVLALSYQSGFYCDWNLNIFNSTHNKYWKYDHSRFKHRSKPCNFISFISVYYGKKTCQERRINEIRRLRISDEWKHMREKLLLILVGKDEGKKLLGWISYTHENSSKIDLSCDMAVWVRFMLFKTECTEQSIGLQNLRTWGISWYLTVYVLLKNEFQIASSFNALNRDSQHAGQVLTFVNICVIIIVFYYDGEEHTIAIEILYQ